MSTNAATEFLKHYAANDASAQRPTAGKRVRVEEGRRKGIEGRVVIPMQDRFNGWKWRYKSDMQAQLQDITGRYGFRVKVESETHGCFWIDAEKVTVLEEPTCKRCDGPHDDAMLEYCADCRTLEPGY